MSAAEAPGGVIMAMGSPGTTRSRTKTMAPTPTSVGGITPSRLMISPHLISVSPCSRVLCRRDQLRNEHAIGFRHHLHSLLVDDRLHGVEQRDHLAHRGEIG